MIEKKNLTIFFMILIFPVAAFAQFYPKVFLDVERGERFIEVESDYTDYDYDIEKSYVYHIVKLGYKQKLDQQSDISFILKNNEKKFSFSGDRKFDNYSNSINCYYKRRISRVFEFKIETNYLTRIFDDEISNDKENYWHTSGLSFKITPRSGNNFFTENSNIYNLKLIYKKQSYEYAPEKNTYANGISGEWERRINKAFKIETRGR